nr:MAG TPA: hypothetical protein [Caudoviricetes sp.]
MLNSFTCPRLQATSISSHVLFRRRDLQRSSYH